MFNRDDYGEGEEALVLVARAKAQWTPLRTDWQGKGQVWT